MPELDTLPCAGCHTPLPPEATGCQICMRPRTKQEIVRGYTKLREDKRRRQRRPLQLAAALLLAAGGFKLFTMFRQPITAAVAAVSRWADNKRDPRNYGTPETPPPAPAAAPIVVPPAPPPPPITPAAPVLIVKPAAPPSAPAEAVPAQQDQPKPPSKDAWRVSGKVYDLATLKAVARAAITFTREAGVSLRVTTDKRGTYEIDLPKGAAWSVSLNSPSHRAGQVIDVDPPFLVRDEDERRVTWDAIVDEDLVPVAVEWPAARATARLDLVAVPRRWKAPPEP